MAARNDGCATEQTSPPGRDPAGTNAPDRVQKQEPADAPKSAAEEAEREQARQLAEGTESPG